MAKRAEIAGKIEHLQDQLRQLVIDLDHIDASIHIFNQRRARKRSAWLPRALGGSWAPTPARGQPAAFYSARRRRAIQRSRADAQNHLSARQSSPRYIAKSNGWQASHEPGRLWQEPP
jgi:hypothetical protein